MTYLLRFRCLNSPRMTGSFHLPYLWPSLARNIAQTWIFARLFEYSAYFIPLILDFICLIVLMMVWQWKPAIGKIFKESRSLNWNFQIGRANHWRRGRRQRGRGEYGLEQQMSNKSRNLSMIISIYIYYILYLLHSELKSHFICSNCKLYVVSIFRIYGRGRASANSRHINTVLHHPRNGGLCNLS